MILNCIVDNRRPEKLPLLEAEMLRQGISYTLWDAEILPNVVESINASHKKIVQYAADAGLPEVAIAEDDVYFPADDGWKYFLANKPKAFYLYLGGCYCNLIVSRKTESDGQWIRVDWGKHYHPTRTTIERSVLSPVGLHCYIINERYYRTFLNTDPTAHIDTAQKGVFKVCYPMAAIQRPGWSANNLENVNYNTILKPEDVYGGLPKF